MKMFPPCAQRVALYNSLNETQKALVTSEEKAALQQASAKADELEVSHVKELISAIGQVTLDKDKQITEANTAYNSLSEELKAKVGNYSVLEKALKELQKLKAGASGSGSGSGSGTGNPVKKPSGSTKSINLSSGKRGGTAASKSGGSTSTKAGGTSMQKRKARVRPMQRAKSFSAKLENAPVALQRSTQKHPLQARYGRWLQGR